MQRPSADPTPQPRSPLQKGKASVQVQFYFSIRRRVDGFCPSKAPTSSHGLRRCEVLQYKPGVYCSGIPVAEGPGKITTAEQIATHEGNKGVALWVVNDQCPPAPGCAMPGKSLGPGSSGISNALVWQYVRSPRTEFARQCGTTYAVDNNCYAPDLPHSAQTFLDLDLSSTADPSAGR